MKYIVTFRKKMISTKELSVEKIELTKLDDIIDFIFNNVIGSYANINLPSNAIKHIAFETFTDYRCIEMVEEISDYGRRGIIFSSGACTNDTAHIGNKFADVLRKIEERIENPTFNFI